MLLASAFISLAAAGNSPQVPKAQLTVIATGILSAWGNANLVCLGENHGSLADAALRRALVEHTDFLTTVDVIVFEGASGIHQQLLDRFIVDGEALSREALQPIWQDAGRGVLWQLPLYEELLRTVRRVNLTVPRPQRVRLIGGALPIPWEKVTTAEDLRPWIDRERHLQRLIQREVLDRALKGLAIFGSFHCEKQGASFAAALQRETPGRVWSAFPFAGEQGARDGRARLGLGVATRLVPITGTEQASKPAGAAFFEGHAYSGASFGDLLDAVIDYGAITDVVLDVDEDTLDPTFRRELARRDQLWREALALWPALTSVSG